MRVRYITPQEDMNTMLRRFDTVFDDQWAGRPETYGKRMAADVYRESDDYFVDIDLPGVSLEDIDIEVEKNTLTVSATRPVRESEDREMIMRGRPFGSFVRRFFLSDGLDVESIQASLDKGVLTLQIPVADESKARKIEVLAGNNAGQIEG